MASFFIDDGMAEAGGNDGAWAEAEGMTAGREDRTYTFLAAYKYLGERWLRYGQGPKNKKGVWIEIQPRFKIQYPMKNQDKGSGFKSNLQYHFVVISFLSPF